MNRTLRRLAAFAVAGGLIVGGVAVASPALADDGDGIISTDLPVDTATDLPVDTTLPTEDVDPTIPPVEEVLPEAPVDDVLPEALAPQALVAPQAIAAVAPTVATECAAYTPAFTSTDVNTMGWTYTETRTKGHNDYEVGYLHVYTDSNDSQSKAAGYNFDNVTDYFLRDGGTTFNINLTNNGGGGIPGLQMGADIDNDGDFDGFLVYEPVYGPGTIWLSANYGNADLSKAPTSVNGGGTGKGGTVNEWLANYPNIKISGIGYSLGSGVKGDVNINSINVGCKSYTFTKFVTPPIVSNVCTSTETLPTATNLDAQGWTTYDYALDAEGTGVFTTDGYTLSTTGDGYFYKDLTGAGILASQMNNLDVDITATGTYGLIFELDGGRNYIHYEPQYYSSGAFWANEADDLPYNPRNGYDYTADSLNELLQDSDVTGIYVYVNGDNDTALRSVSYNCKLQPFGYEAPATTAPADPTSTATPGPTVSADNLAETGVDPIVGFLILVGIVLLGAGLGSIVLPLGYKR